MSETILPKDWKLVNLKSISESIQYGYTESSSKVENGPKFLRITDIQDNKVNWEDVPYCKIDEIIKSKYLLKEGDLVFARTGATVGKSFLIKGKIPEAVFASYLIRVRVNLEINEKYLSYFFHSPEYWRQITNDQVGTGQPNVNGTKLGLLKIVIPPLQTQQAIVSKTEELFSELDKGIEDLKTAQQQLKTYRQSVLKWAFEGKLTNENVKEGELPKGWVLKDLGEIFKVSSGKGIKINQLKGGDYCVYGGNGLNGYHSEYFIEESVLIIGRVGVKCGVTHITKPKSWVSDNALIVKPIIEDFDIKFLKLRLEFENLNKLSVSTAQPVISGNSIYSVSIFLPKLKEQHLIVQEIESRLSVADKMEESIAQSLQQAEALRQSILKKAFSGELV